jgi:hypothetical protein
MRGTRKTNTSLALWRSFLGFFTGYSSQIARILYGLLIFQVMNMRPSLRRPELTDR